MSKGLNGGCVNTPVYQQYARGMPRGTVPDCPNFLRWKSSPLSHLRGVAHLPGPLTLCCIMGGYRYCPQWVITVGRTNAPCAKGRVAERGRLNTSLRYSRRHSVVWTTGARDDKERGGGGGGGRCGRKEGYWPGYQIVINTNRTL